MVLRRITKNCWSFGLVWESDIYYISSYKGGNTGTERITGETIDISEWNDFGYYKMFQYWDKQESEENPRISRWLGMSHRVCSALCYWVLTYKGKVIARTTVQHVTNGEAATDDFHRSIGHYHKCLAEDFGRGNHYASDLDGLEGFTNDDVPNPYETY